MGTTININLRLPPTLHANLKQKAKAEGISLNTTILVLLTFALVEQRRSDADFQDRLANIIREDQEILKRLAR